jgi:hypothetical protein
VITLPLVGVVPEPVTETVTTAEDVVNSVDTDRGLVLLEMANVEARIEAKLTHIVSVVEKMASEKLGIIPASLPSAAEVRSASSARKRLVAAQTAAEGATTPATSTRRARTSGAGSSTDPIVFEE